MWYIVALLAMCAVYTVALWAMKFIRSLSVFNIVFVLVVFLSYISIGVIVYLDVGFYDWNFQNLLPVANVSPFMFSSAPFMLLLPKRARNHALLLVSMLSVGMLLSSVFGCLYNAFIHYKFHFHFMLDYIAHFTLSLFGIYLIRSEQVKATKKGFFISGALIYGIVGFMMLLNLIFDTSYFGLSLNGKHNIYNNVIVDNSYLSALIYCIGLLCVLLMGVWVSSMASKKCFFTAAAQK